MTAEYSYFRAKTGGQSFAAIQTVQASRLGMRDLKRGLCSTYNANEVWGHVPRPNEKAAPGLDAGHYYIDMLIFNTDEDVPEGWVFTQHVIPGMHGSLAAAKPAPGTEDDFHLRQVRVLLDEYFQTQSLEKVFGCGEMPQRKLPPGNYNGKFVMHERLIRTNPNPDERFKNGMLSDTATFLFGSNSSCTIADPMDYKYLNNNWYIRVPNNANGEPVFTPPDSEPVSYSKMQELDQREFYHPTFKGVYIR